MVSLLLLLLFIFFRLPSCRYRG